MDNATYNEEVRNIIKKASGNGDYGFIIAQYNKSGNCIFNAYMLGMEADIVFELMNHALRYHPLAEFSVMKAGDIIVSKHEYQDILYWEND